MMKDDMISLSEVSSMRKKSKNKNIKQILISIVCLYFATNALLFTEHFIKIISLLLEQTTFKVYRVPETFNSMLFTVANNSKFLKPLKCLI